MVHAKLTHHSLPIHFYNDIHFVPHVLLHMPVTMFTILKTVEITVSKPFSTWSSVGSLAASSPSSTSAMGLSKVSNECAWSSLHIGISRGTIWDNLMYLQNSTGVPFSKALTPRWTFSEFFCFLESLMQMSYLLSLHLLFSGLVLSHATWRESYEASR